MKRINIKSLLQAKDSFKQDDYRSFLRHYGVEVRDAEIEDLRSFIEELCSAKCGMGDSQYNKEHHENYFEDVCKTSHQIIGQEFEGVVVVIDKFFSYREDGNLVYVGGSYYDVSKMLFQNITRSRKRLNIVIVENEQLLNRCFEILK